VRNIAESNMLLRIGIDLPAGFKLATEEFREGWNFVQTGDVKRLEKKVRVHGRNLLRNTDALLRSGVGDTAQQAIANALKLALRSLNDRFNAAEIEHIVLTQYPWFFLVRITVSPCLIQQSTMVPASHDTPDLDLGGIMPQLKQMLVVSQDLETSAK
jgi:hypothetical protein